MEFFVKNLRIVKSRLPFRFILLFMIYFGVFYLMINLSWIKANLIIPLAGCIAWLSGWLISQMDFDVMVSGQMINHFDELTLEVTEKCTGIYQMGFLSAGILSTQAGTILKLKAIFIGTFILSVCNMIRIVSIFVIGIYRPALSIFIHDIIWEAILILLLISIFIVWYLKYVNVPSSHNDL